MRLKQEYAFTDTGCVRALRERVVGTCADIQRHKASSLFTVVNRVDDDLVRKERGDECNDQKDGDSLHYSPLLPSLYGAFKTSFQGLSSGLMAGWLDYRQPKSNSPLVIRLAFSQTKAFLY
jgi:hypothetical protein